MDLEKSIAKISEETSDDSEVPSDEFKQKQRFYFCHSTRYFIMLAAIFCLTCVMSNSVALNFTIICMTNGEDHNVSDVTKAIPDETYHYTSIEKGWLFSSVSIGSLLGILIMIKIFPRLGTRNTFTIYGIISGLATLLIPISANLGFYYLCAMRFVQGLAIATSFPSLCSITAHWSSSKDSGMYISLLSVHVQLGLIFTMPVSGAFCTSSFGWKGIFYLQGIMTLVSFLIFYGFIEILLIYIEHAVKTKHAPFFMIFPNISFFHMVVSYWTGPLMPVTILNVSQVEFAKIMHGKPESHPTKRQKVPYWAILKDPEILSIFSSSLGGAFGVQIFLQYGPIYLHKVMNFDVASTGFAAASPYVVAGVFKILAGPLSDSFTFLSERNRVLIFAIAAYGPMAIGFILLAVLPVDYTVMAQIAYNLVIGFAGLNCVGVAKSVVLVSQQFSHFVVAICSCIYSVIALIMPLFIAFWAPDNTPEQWASMFYLIAGVIVITQIPFIITAKAEPATWTKSQGSTISTKFSIPNLGEQEEKEKLTEH